MNSTRQIIFSSFLFLVVGCGEQRGVSTNKASLPVDVATTSSGEIYFLEPKVFEEQVALARKGDAGAAMRVARHFSLGENDTEQSIPWLEIAAEKGDVLAMQNIANSLSALGGEENCQLALSWFERAKREMVIANVDPSRIDDSINRLRHRLNECSEGRGLEGVRSVRNQ